MKYTPKMYAEALVDAIGDNKNASQEKKVVDRFLLLLEKQGDVKRFF